jgi:predicted phage gp36 major capsid-like protein
MYGDTDVVRALARELRARAGEIRSEAGDLLARAEAVPWTGLTADAMRRLARAHAAELRRCAGEHEAAADALDRHAREVDHLVDLIAAIERKARRLVDSAAGGLAGLVGHVVPGPLDDWLQHFDPPPHGSREWLDVHLPRSA